MQICTKGHMLAEDKVGNYVTKKFVLVYGYNQ